MEKTFKTLLGLFLLLTISISSAFSTIDFGKNNDFQLDFAPIDPLYKESLAYPFANTFRFNYMIAPKTEGNVANTILVSADNGGSPSYKELEYKDPNTHNTKFWGLKSSINIGILRLTYKDIAAVEGYIHGGINTVFGAYGGVDCLGFDGQYGAGISALLLDSIALRAGFHHFSGHWGDEILNDFYSKGYSESEYKTITEYTRNNSWYLGASYDLKGYLRFAVDAELPMANSWIRPAAHVPAETTKPSSEESPEDANTAEHIWSQEGFDDRDNHHYPDSYKAWRIGLSIEAQYPIKNVGRVYAALDLQLHQDGKIDIATADYNADLPWKKEFSAVLGFAFQDYKELPEFAVELGYHKGRFPLLNYWFQDVEYFSVGIGLTL
jgi:hypothetical protein